MGSPGSPIETLRVHPELKDVDDGPDGGQLNMPADGTANAAIVTCVRRRKDGVTLLTLRPTDALGTINNTCKESGGGGGADGVGSYGSISHTKMNPPLPPLPRLACVASFRADGRPKTAPSSIFGASPTRPILGLKWWRASWSRSWSCAARSPYPWVIC